MFPMEVKDMRVLVCTDPDTIHSQRLLNSLSHKCVTALYWFNGKRKLGKRSITRFPLILDQPLNFRGLWRLSNEYAVISTLACFRPDVIHVHRTPAICHQFKRWSPRTPVIFTSWGHIPQEFLSGEFGQQISAADGFTADSQPLLNELNSIPRCEEKPTRMFRFGVNRDLFKPAPPSQKLKTELGVPLDCKLVYSARSLRSGYNHETLVRAMPMVLDRVPNVYFIFVNNHGHRYPDSLEYSKQLKAEMQKSRTIGYARFMDHIDDHSRVVTLMQTADVVVSIPIEDGFPATIFEAMACGTPLIVSDLPDYAGVVNNANAILVQPNDVHGLGQKLIALLTDEELHSRLRIAGLETAASKGDFENEVSMLLDFYKTLQMNLGRD